MKWYEYPRIDNYGFYPDPYGPYKKPDSNIECPPGIDVTVLASGVVTGVESPSWANGLMSVTVRLDTPVNSLATHMAYNFIAGVVVSVGDRLAKGDKVGVSTSKQGFGLAFALCSDDVYGTTNFTRDNGNALLNPVPVLNAAKNGINIPGLSGDTSLGDLMANFGEWIAVNIFREDRTLVDSISGVSKLPYIVIGSVIFALSALIVVSLFFILTGV